MAQSSARKLDSGNPFPDFAINLLGASATTAKAALSGGWSVLLLYRGHW